MTVRLRDRGLRRISRELSLLGGAKITVGFLDGKTATIAAFQEFGTVHITAAPFMRLAIRDNVRAIQSAQVQIIRAVIAGRFDAKSGAEALADFIRRLIVKQIDTAGSWAPPLSEETRARKGGDPRLVDRDAAARDGRTIMRDAVQVKVEL